MRTERGEPVSQDRDRGGGLDSLREDGSLREAPQRRLRVGVDMSILRHPRAGTARYAVELLSAMQSMAAPSETLIPVAGFPRSSRGHRVRRYFNLATDLIWWSAGSLVTCATRRIDAWFSPANTLPLALPRRR